MPRQRTLPREAFLDKLNSYIAQHIARASSGGARITRASIARQLGDFHRVTLYKWLNGSSSIPKEIVDKLCTLVGLSNDERYELLWLGGYIEGATPSSISGNGYNTGNEAYVSRGKDNPTTTTRSDQQAEITADNTPALPTSHMSAELVASTPTQSGFAQRCADLDTHISQALEVLKEYEDRQRLTDDPRTQRRIMRHIADLRAQLLEYKREQYALGCPQRGI